MPNKILSKNTSSSSEFNARKLSLVANRIQIFYLDIEGFIIETCEGIWKINKEINFFNLFEAFKIHKEAIDFLFKQTGKEEKSLAIYNLKIFFEEEFFYINALFTIKKSSDKSTDFFLECLIEDKTEHYQSLKDLEEKHKLQEIEFLNEKWQLNKDTELLEVNHQTQLATLDEQLRINWTNLLAENLKKIATQNFIQSSFESNSEIYSNNNFENLIALSNSFEKISGICLFPSKMDIFLSQKNTVTYLGKNNIHQKLIQNLVELAGGNFIEKNLNNDTKQRFKFDFSEIDFIFIEQEFITEEIINTDKFCFLVEPTFLEQKQNLINNKTKLLIYPLYPFQVWQQLLSFTNTTIMSYHEHIDLSQIYEIVDNEPMLVQSMLQILDKNLREYPAQLQQEFNDGELDTLRQTVHKFKSCTAYTGLTEFNDTLSEIEASQENGWTIAQIKDKLEFVLQAIPIIKVQVEEKLKELEEEIS
ncbi:HPt domain-containing protein [Bernardetia litoralis DSM 6794]|uniref:HPt domain-containing protein n=1 Tax=Bernardetia litoralis (strain ATCC 23117 / DSM 6794 / NBRC 15988 / NCIMB 1366 / Fx l1 / Sio-4) TaxID=880071 RepID=I4ALZ3_BERLS|nr:Hpt domain-containing protein [Bernardetia litoralis]AFM04978.1 HPt domain-containing protein [Bernardetia litoralis DSM 6794]